MHCYYSKRYCFYWKKNMIKPVFIVIFCFRVFLEWIILILPFCWFVLISAIISKARKSETQKYRQRIVFSSKTCTRLSYKLKKNTEADISVFSMYLCKEKIAASTIILSIMHNPNQSCQCVLQYIRWKQYSANCCSSYSSKECASLSCLNSSITENHNNILYANLKKKIWIKRENKQVWIDVLLIY